MLIKDIKEGDVLRRGEQEVIVLATGKFTEQWTPCGTAVVKCPTASRKKVVVAVPRFHGTWIGEGPDKYKQQEWFPALVPPGQLMTRAEYQTKMGQYEKAKRDQEQWYIDQEKQGQALYTARLELAKALGAPMYATAYSLNHLLTEEKLLEILENPPKVKRKVAAYRKALDRYNEWMREHPNPMTCRRR